MHGFAAKHLHNLQPRFIRKRFEYRYVAIKICRQNNYPPLFYQPGGINTRRPAAPGAKARQSSKKPGRLRHAFYITRIVFFSKNRYNN
jgi:hypothetical protein